ncbi:MAG: DUF523 domain-containing protein [bacterium]
MEKVLVSACLLGVNCKYNGSNNLCDVKSKLVGYEIIQFCPEVSGGLSIPRVSCEILNNKVINKNNEDKTFEFNKGANLALELCKKHNIKLAVLKEKSPSCGVTKIYDGTFSGNLIDGSGVTTSLLKENGIEVINEIDIFK